MKERPGMHGGDPESFYDSSAAELSSRSCDETRLTFMTALCARTQYAHRGVYGRGNAGIS